MTWSINVLSCNPPGRLSISGNCFHFDLLQWFARPPPLMGWHRLGDSSAMAFVNGQHIQHLLRNVLKHVETSNPMFEHPYEMCQKKWRCGMLVETYDLDRRSDGALKEKDDWIREHQIIQKETKFKWYQNHLKIIPKSPKSSYIHPKYGWWLNQTSTVVLCFFVVVASSSRSPDQTGKTPIFLDVISMSV